MSSPRCPYCHDAIQSEAPDRIGCLGCGAHHHAECFLEGEGCSGTGCGASTARVGEAEVTLTALAQLSAEHLADLARRPPAPARGRGSALLLGLLLAAFLGSSGYGLSGLGGLGAGVAVGVALAWILVRPGRSTPRLRLTLGPQMGFDAITGVWRTDQDAIGVPADPLGPVREWLEEGPPPSTAVGPPPSECPWCAESLEPDEPLAYCYHCGGQLGPVPQADPDPEGEHDAGKAPRRRPRPAD